MEFTQPFNVPDVVTTVLLDIGGVLYVDPWETLILTRRGGIADRLGLDRAVAAAAGRELWKRFAVMPSTESAYWKEFSRACDIKVAHDLVEEVSRQLLRPTPWADALLDLVGDRRVGVVTDNTTFWYARQREELRLSRRIDPVLEFTSFQAGVRKKSNPSLLSVAALRCDPARTLVVDDRAANLECATAIGFHTQELPYAGGD